MKVLVLGASGIVGQHMRLCVPAGIEPVWVRNTPDRITQGIDITAPRHLRMLLSHVKPDVVVNLAGVSSVDEVQRDREETRRVNQFAAIDLICECADVTKVIQVSTQAVFSGVNPPYSPFSPVLPSNIYGQQKAESESAQAVIVRLTFVLGMRPLPHVGRQNPLEAMLAGQSPQVSDRYFSPLFAMDAAELLWDAVLTARPGEIRHLGQPITTTRFDIARLVNPDVTACSHDDFPGLANRPRDTTYAGSSHLRELATLPAVVAQYRADDRAIELALFFGIRWDAAKAKFGQGFGPLHNEVTACFNRAPRTTDAELLEWYRTTEAYIWELSAYHEDAGFNYSGMCRGISGRLKTEPDTVKVLCLGDGIGDLTLHLMNEGFDAVYHDLGDSRTAEYAAFRFWRNTGGPMPTDHTFGFGVAPDAFGAGRYDAICSLDFLEHVPNVEEWVRAVHGGMRIGGLFCAQNAFACGSGPDGSIPMHLAVNDRFEKDWDPLLFAVGFEQLSSNWYRKVR